MALLETDTFSNLNIGSAAQTLGSYTAAAGRWVLPRVFVNGLASSASTLTFNLTITPSGGSEHYGIRFSDSKVTGQLTAYAGQFQPVWLNSGDALTLYLSSSNSSDNSADGTLEWVDVMPLQPTTAGRALVVDASGLADATTVKVGPSGSGTAQTAADLGTKAGGGAANSFR